MRIRQLILVSLTMFCMSGCKNNDNPVSGNAPLEILPLKVGNTWTIKHSNIDTLGTVTSIDTIVISVLKDTVIQNQTWYITSFGIYRNSPEGLWQWYYSPIFVNKYPGSVSDTIIVTGNTVEIVSTNEPQVTPTGTLSCYHYRITQPNSGGFQMHSYYSPGVGWVSFESAYLLSPGRWSLNGRYQLIAFHIQ